MKFKKIMSLLLVLTLISSLLTTVSLLNPMAEDGEEATTPAETTNYDTYVLHAKGASGATSRGIYVPIVKGTDIKVGETYTVIVTVQGLTMTDYSYVFIKSGDSGVNAVATCQGAGEKISTYSGATQWVADITPTAASTWFLGIYLNSTYLPNADFYVGAVQVIDKNGNNIALDFTQESAIYGMASPTGGVQYGTDESKYYELRTMIDIDDVEDETLKKTLFDNFYIGDTMINFKKGSVASAQLLNIYKKIPASKLKANTTYTFTARYNNPEQISNASRYFVVREPRGGARTDLTSVGTVTKLSGYVDCYEFKAEYTIGETVTDLYVGFHMNGSSWGAADFYIAYMNFVEKGEVKNLLTPLACMDYYCATAASTTSYINPYTATAPASGNVYTFVAVTKYVLDKDRYFEPENKEASKYILHAKGLGNTDVPQYGMAFYIRIPADKIEANKTYTVSLIQQGFVMDDYSYLAVRQGASSSATGGGKTLARSSKAAPPTTTYAGAYSWTVEVTPTVKADLYVGLNMQEAKLEAGHECYFGNLKVIDENGENIAPELFPSTTIYRSQTHSTGIGTSLALASYFQTIEFVRTDRIADEELSKKIFQNFYSGDVMYHFTGSGANAHSFYKKIPASKLTAGAKYKLSIKYSGVDLTNLVRLRNSEPRDNKLAGVTYEIVKHDTYSEYTAYYTVPEITDESEAILDLYIGFYLVSATWESANFYIGDMQFVDTNGNNLFTPLSDMSDLYAGFDGGAIADLIPSYANYSLLTVEKQGYDADRFSDPDTGRKMVNIKGLSSGNSARTYFKLSGVLPGTYQVSYKTKGFEFNDSDRYFAVKTKVSHSEDTVRTAAGTNLPETLVSQPSLDEATYQFTTTDFSDIYVGFGVKPSLVPSTDYIIENLELVRIEDGIASENLIDENMNLATWYRFDNNYSNSITKMPIPASGSYTYNSNFTVSLVDYDESKLYPDQIVTIKGGTKNNSANYEYGKQAEGLKAGKYRLTLVEQGVDIKTKDDPFFRVFVNGNVSLSTYEESNRAKVEMIDGATSSYKLQYDVTVDEDGGIIYGGFKSAPANMPDFNLYLVELSLVEIDEEGNALSENLFSALNVRDWRMVEDDFALLTWDKYTASSNQSIKNIDLGVADANGNGKVDVADIRIVSKLQDAGVEVTDATNIITIRNTLLGKVS